MPNLSQMVENFLHPQPLDYTKRSGNVMFLDDRGLKRPQKMPLSQKIIAGALVVAGIAIGAFILNSTVYEAARQSALSQESVETNIQREASIVSLPQLANIANVSDDDLKTNIKAQGFTVYDATTDGDSGISIYKLPADVSLADAGILYARGISSLTASQATLLLNGSWQLSTSHEGSNTVVMRYADFQSTSTESALSAVMNQEGITAADVGDSGTDDSGNTYRAGTIEIADKTYNWRASAIELDKLYDIKGMPDAYYVGLRLTEAS
mgnify:CR=1 FL=1